MPNIGMEYEPNGVVLKNKLGIRSRRSMVEREYWAYLRTRDHYWSSTGSRRKFDAAFILAIHRHFLGPIYEWAGGYRTVDPELSSVNPHGDDPDSGG